MKKKRALPKPEPVDQEMSQEQAADALRMLACTITDDYTFIKVLKDADPALREQVYDQIAPHVAYVPRPFALMSFEDA